MPPVLLRTILCCGFLALSAATPPYAQRADVQAYIHETAKAQGLDEAWVTGLLAGVQPRQDVLALAAPTEAVRIKNWRSYRSRFLDRPHVKAGTAFWRAHAATLERAQRTYGVPAEIIVGILGVETLYGQYMGRFPVLDSLVTLSFDYPATAANRDARVALFRQQLSDFLVLCRDHHRDPHEFLGSYTGAIGIPQFLPGSIRAYAVDFDGDGRVDLRGSAEDAIGSVARFLQAHGWELGRPVFWNVSDAAASRKVLEERADGAPTAKHRLGDLMDAGLAVSTSLRARNAERDTRVILVDLPTPGRRTEYRVGFQNFYVLTRYNRSFFYAMAVAELGRAVKLKAVRPSSGGGSGRARGAGKRHPAGDSTPGR